MRSYEFVYFIRPKGMYGPVKIGCTIDVERRLKDIQKMSPLILEIAAFASGGLNLERKLHAYFEFSHSHGEWFKSSGELDLLIAELRAGIPIADAIDLSSVKILRSGTLGASSVLRQKAAA